MKTPKYYPKTLRLREIRFLRRRKTSVKDKFMVTDAQKKWMLESSLSAIDDNFYERAPQTGERITRTFSPPTLDEVVDNYGQDANLREKIEQMLDADAIKRLYAAILLWEVDRTRAADVLGKSTFDNTKISIQARLGFSVIATTVGILARDFLSEQQIHGDNFTREEGLDNWALAVSTEKRELKQDFDKTYLPKWMNVLEAREDAEKLKKLRLEIDRLKNGDSVAEKFYAAALLNTIDESESKKVLESLLTETTEVSILSGDEMDNVPAHQVAENILNPEKYYQPSEPTNPIAQVTKWLEKTFFGKNTGG